MKNLILFTAFLLTLISCESDDNNGENFLKKETIKNLEQNVTDTYEYNYNSKDLLSGYQHYKNGELFFDYKYTYNDSDQLIEIQRDFTQPNEIAKTYKYYYNSNGNLSSEKHYNNGVLDAIFEWNYSNTSLITRTAKNPQNQLLYTQYYTIENGNIKSIKTDEADPNKVDQIFDYQTYDTNAYKYTRIPLLLYLKPTLNTNNPKIAIRKNAATGDIFDHYRYEYQFNEKGKYNKIDTYNQLNNQLKYVCEYEWGNK